MSKHPLVAVAPNGRVLNSTVAETRDMCYRYLWDIMLSPTFRRAFWKDVAGAKRELMRKGYVFSRCRIELVR